MDGVDKLSEGGLQVVERKFSQDTGQSDVIGNACFSKSKKLFELQEVNLGPSFDFGEGGNVGEQTKENESEGGGKGMRCSLFGAGIGNFFKTANEDVEGDGFGHD